LSDFSLASSSSTHTTTSGSSFGNDYSSSTTSLDEQALLYAQEYNRRAAAAGYTLPSSSDRFGAPAGSSSYARQPPVPSFMTAAPPPHQPAPTPVAYSSTNEAFGLPPRSFTPSLLASRQDQPSDYTSRSRRSSMIGPPSTSSLSNFEDGIGGNGGGTDNRLSMMSSGGHPAPPRPRLGPSADAFWPEKKSHQSKGLRPFVNRAVFTAQQREGLETLYAQVMYPEASSMNALAEELEMTEKQVRTWFANRRQSERNAPAGSDYSRRTSYG
jgi:hypothetical protein